MENTFIPNPLAPPGLMMLSPQQEGQENVRLPPPHSMTRPSSEKEMPPQYNNHSFMFRPGEPFPQPMYAHIPPYAQSNLERGLGIMHPGSSSAFRPVTTSEGETFHSAFLPAKKPKNSDSNISAFHGDSIDNEIHDGGDISDGPDSHISSTVRDERPSSISSTNCETNSEVNSDIGDSERSTPDEGRHMRKPRKKNVLDGQTLCCPVCGLTLRCGEIESHYKQELERLEKIGRCGRRSRDTTPQNRKTQPSPCSSKKGKESPSLEVVSQARFDSFMRIRCNRQSRLNCRSKTRKRKPDDMTVCPVCNERLLGTPEELNEHVEICLKRRGDGEDMRIDIEGDDEESYEEYTWAGQTRIRASSLLEGGFAASGFTTTKKGMDEDIDVNVDGDEGEQYGRSQYSEVDIVPCSSDEPKEDRERQALRVAVLRASSDNMEHTVNNTEELMASISQANNTDVDDVDGMDLQESSASEVISGLKAKLKDREERLDKSKCLICMDSYHNPLTSIQCWHVHCEQCWLKSLGAKKLCPQCNMITSPADLRRIYL